MKQKIIAELKTVYAKLGLSDEAFDGVASLLEKTIKEEAEIATAVGGDDVKALLRAIQGNVDSWRGKFHDKEKELDTYKAKHPEEGGEQEPSKTAESEVEPEWAKKLREQNEKIQRQLDERSEAEKSRATLDSVKKKLEDALRGDEFEPNKGIVSFVLKGFSLKENETEEAAVDRLKTEYASAYKETFGDGPVAQFGVHRAAGDDTKKATSAMNEMLRREGLLAPENKE